jgi:hypothetical protein
MNLVSFFHGLLPAAALLTVFGLNAQGQQPPPRITQVMATLQVNPGITREQIMPVMDSEVRETVQLHLDGVIQQWWGKGDGKGVVFILNCRSENEARAILDKLPLIEKKLATFTYVELAPLAPLRLLLAPAAEAR